MLKESWAFDQRRWYLNLLWAIKRRQPESVLTQILFAAPIWHRCGFLISGVAPLWFAFTGQVDALPLTKCILRFGITTDSMHPQPSKWQSHKFQVATEADCSVKAVLTSGRIPPHPLYFTYCRDMWRYVRLFHIFFLFVSRLALVSLPICVLIPTFSRTHSRICSEPRRCCESINVYRRNNIKISQYSNTLATSPQYNIYCNIQKIYIKTKTEKKHSQCLINDKCVY